MYEKKELKALAYSNIKREREKAGLQLLITLQEIGDIPCGSAALYT